MEALTEYLRSFKAACNNGVPKKARQKMVIPEQSKVEGKHLMKVTLPAYGNKATRIYIAESHYLGKKETKRWLAETILQQLKREVPLTIVRAPIGMRYDEVKVNEVETLIGYKFMTDRGLYLLKVAMLCPTASGDYDDEQIMLAQVGDSLIKSMVTSDLFDERDASCSPYTIAQKMAEITRNRTISLMGGRIDIGRFIIRRKNDDIILMKTLSMTIVALIGAVWNDIPDPGEKNLSGARQVWKKISEQVIADMDEQ